MSDISIDSYGTKNKNSGENPFEIGLTKSKHNNPDLHVIGDNLPSNLVAYDEGSGSLSPDLAGNSPKLLRQVLNIAGNNTAQNCTASLVQCGTFSQAVTCPVVAGAGAFIRIVYSIQLNAIGAGGANVNFAWLQLQASGTFIQGSESFWQQAGMGNSNTIWPAHKDVIQSINPGQTVTIQLLQAQNTVTTPQYNFATNMSPSRSFLRCELYY